MGWAVEVAAEQAAGGQLGVVDGVGTCLDLETIATAAGSSGDAARGAGGGLASRARGAAGRGDLGAVVVLIPAAGAVGSRRRIPWKGGRLKGEVSSLWRGVSELCVVSTRRWGDIADAAGDGVLVTVGHGRGMRRGKTKDCGSWRGASLSPGRCAERLAARPALEGGVGPLSRKDGGLWLQRQR